jgi:O-antigen/teichoic acid export membrane protein
MNHLKASPTDRPIAHDSVAAAAQVVVAGVVMFLAYRVIATELGVSALGIWAASMSMAAFVNLADLGVSESMLRMLPGALQSGDARRSREVTELCISFVAVSTGLVAFLVYLPYSLLMRTFIPPADLAATQVAVPLAFAAAWLNSVVACVLYALEGSQRYDRRSTIVVVANLLYLGGVLLLVPRFGLRGLGFAVLVQSASQVVMGWLVVRKQLGIPRWIPRPARFDELRGLIALGAPIKLAAVLNLLCEPLTKVLVLAFGGSHLSGIFEMATRLPSQVRAIIVAVAQVIVPRMIRRVASGAAIDELYEYSCAAVLTLAAAGFSVLLLLLPAVSHFWLGETDATFLLYAVLMSAGWLANSLCTPAYFSLLATGRMRWNIAGQLVQAAVNVAVGGAAGWLFGGTGVVAGAVVAQVACAAVIILVARPVVGALFIKPTQVDRRYLLLSLAGCWALYTVGALHWPVADTWWLSLLAAAGFLPLSLYYLWSQPTGRELVASLMPRSGAALGLHQ